MPTLITLKHVTNFGKQKKYAVYKNESDGKLETNL